MRKVCISRVCGSRENYQEKADILRIGLKRIRVPEIWLGDLRAQIGACKTGERRVLELLDRYGPETIMDFVEDWFDYGRRRTDRRDQKAAVRRLRI